MNQTVKDGLHARVRLSPNGRFLIPSAIREQMGFEPGESLFMQVEDGVLRVESYRARIGRIQREFARYIKPGVLLSDELVAGRREEARREAEELARDLEQERLRNGDVA